MTTRTLDIRPHKAPDGTLPESGVIPDGTPPESGVIRGLTPPESGVIRDAERHRRRERIAASLLVLALVAAALFLVAQGNDAQIQRSNSSHPRWMAGAPLGRSTDLRLLVSDNGGRPSIVDVASRRVQAVTGLGLPRIQRLWSPMLWPLAKVPGGALGVVIRHPCNRCVEAETHYLISPAGSVRRLSSFTLRSDQFATTPVLGSSTAIWVLTHPHNGPCTLREEPGSDAAVTVPCGDLVDDTVNGPDTSAGLVISTSNRMVLIDPHSGQIHARSPINGHLDVLSRNLVLTSGPNGIQGQNGAGPPLTVINLRTGAHRQLRWPSTLRFGYEVFPDPRSSLVALDFADPAYKMTSLQAGDVWLLNSRTGALTHIPGFPIFEYLKVSGMAWTTDHRLVIVAHGRHRTTIGIWRPGEKQLHVGTVPALSGYTEFVPFVG
jgi:hypothetical protein